MLLAPFIVINIIISLVTFLILGAGIGIGYYWYRGILVGIEYLILSIALLLFSFFGRHLTLFLLGHLRKNHEIFKSHPLPHSWKITLKDESILHIEEDQVNAKQTLILIHGWGLDHTIWTYLYTSLKGSINIVAYDLAGQGKSKGSANNDYSLEKYADDLKAVIDHQTTPVIIAGHSIGGMIILTFCKKYPHYLKLKIQKMILVHTTYTDPTRTSFLSSLLHRLKKPLLVPMNYLTITLSPFIKLNNWLNYQNGILQIATMFIGFGGSESPAQIDYIARFQYTSSPAINARGTNAMFDYEARDILKKITIPTLIITGDRDKLTKKEAGEFIHKNILHSEILELDHAGHMGFMERWKEANLSIKSFIKSSSHKN